MRRPIWILCTISVLAGAAHAQQAATTRTAPATEAPVPLPRWIDGFRPRAIAAGITPATFDGAMSTVVALPDVVRLDRNQTEFTRTIWAYLDTAVSDQRVRNGRAALARHAGDLDRIEACFGVPREIVVAIWGLESSYGAFRGNTPTLSALATLAADGRRAAFFEAQLIEALRIVQSGAATPDRLRGSWAGAMGHTQFMPTSFRDHAVDFDRDGQRNIWGEDPVDALASTAAYLRHFGWTTGQPWGVEVRLPEGFDYLLSGERVEKSAPEWMDLGVVPAGGGALPNAGPISIRVPAGHTGVALATYENFRVLESYNTADAYVIGVGHLADRIAGGAPFAAGWPRQDDALTRSERIELQTRLQRAGFDPLKIDARIGPNTLDAIQRWQRSRDLIADGYVGPQLLARLRAETD